MIFLQKKRDLSRVFLYLKMFPDFLFIQTLCHPKSLSVTFFQNPTSTKFSAKMSYVYTIFTSDGSVLTEFGFWVLAISIWVSGLNANFNQVFFLFFPPILGHFWRFFKIEGIESSAKLWKIVKNDLKLGEMGKNKLLCIQPISL